LGVNSGEVAPAPFPGKALSAAARARRGFFGAAVTVAVAVLVVGVLWLATLHAPSSGRDPNMPALAPSPTRTAEATATSPSASASSTPEETI
jgi:hypothetical protein